MNARQIALPLILGGTLLVLWGCGERHEATQPVESEAREVGSFDSISMQGGARLEISIGKSVAVNVEGPQDAVSRVQTEVRGETLHIKSKPKDWFMSRGRPRITIRISLPKLASLQLEGGNDVRMNGFAGGESTIEVEGAAHIEADGYLDELTVHMAGAGDADFSKLVAGQAKITVDGVGRVYVHPKETLDATMNGVGAILYVGSPREVNTRMNGLGTIGQRQPEDLEDEEKERDEAEPVDPDSLQPEREEEAPPAALKNVESTEVI